jgi:predicted anti-sigma-YlaC factor YlaD
MRLISFYDWIRRIYATQDDELGCDDLFELLPAYVDREICGDPLPARACEIEDHLRQCPYCYDLYVSLRDASLLDEERAILEAVPIERCPPPPH